MSTDGTRPRFNPLLPGLTRWMLRHDSVLVAMTWGTMVNQLASRLCCVTFGPFEAFPFLPPCHLYAPCGVPWDSYDSYDVVLVLIEC